MNADHEYSYLRLSSSIPDLSTPLYREVKRKSHLEFSKASVYKISLFGSRGVRKYYMHRKF